MQDAGFGSILGAFKIPNPEPPTRGVMPADLVQLAEERSYDALESAWLEADTVKAPDLARAKRLF